MPPNSQMKVDIKRRCGNLLSYHTREASRIALVAGKDNSPHQGYVRSHWGLYKPMIWCPCLLSSRLLKFCENFTNEDNFNNTCLSKCPSLPLLDRNCDKVSKKKWMSISISSKFYFLKWLETYHFCLFASLIQRRLYCNILP